MATVECEARGMGLSERRPMVVPALHLRSQAWGWGKARMPSLIPKVCGGQRGCGDELEERQRPDD